MGEAEGKGSRYISAHVTPSEPAAAFQQTQIAAACPAWWLWLCSPRSAGQSLTAPPWRTHTEQGPVWTLPPLLSAHLHWPSNCFHLDWQTRSLPCLPAFLPWLAVVRKGTGTTGNSSNSTQQLEFNPAIIYTDMMLTVHFRDFSQCCFRQP